MNPLRGLLSNWRRDERGSITIEFVVWLPLLAFWLVVSALFFDAYKSRNDAAKVAQTLADIVSRRVEVDDAFIAELYELQDKLLPRAPAGTRLRVSSIRHLAGGIHQVAWSRAVGAAPLTNEMIPPELLPEMAVLDTVILTELYVPYEPFTDWGGVGNRTWSFALVARPRFVSAIAMLD